MTKDPQGFVIGASKSYDSKVVPSLLFKIVIGIPREGEDLDLDFEITDESTFDPETEDFEIVLESSPYILEDGSWGKNEYEDFCKDMISLSMTRGWKLLLAPDAPAELTALA
ncbi:MAG: hypothetical protein Q8M83_01895 [bacterium]|nr:hypothetical protein [bacterium]